MLAKGSAEVIVTLPSETEIRFTRFFRHPRQLLFEAWTRPEHIRHWWGCNGSSIPVCEIDLRVGGSWKIIMRMPNGSDHPFRGAYREIVPGKQLVYSECYDDLQVGRPEWLTTVIFEEIESGTQLTHTIRHNSRQARDGHLQSGMESGAIQSFRQLDEHVARVINGDIQLPQRVG
jgi:uncharacterized protein YndB with AHSA1/START domain